jgi:hypothetical protein
MVNMFRSIPYSIPHIEIHFFKKDLPAFPLAMALEEEAEDDDVMEESLISASPAGKVSLVETGEGPLSSATALQQSEAAHVPVAQVPVRSSLR